MKNLTKEEIILLLKQLRDQLKDVIESNKKFDNDFYLYKWLQHEGMKVNQTEIAIRKSIAWRKSVNLEELAEREWSFFAPGIENEIRVCFEGISKDGHPVSSTNGEGVNIRQMIEKYGKESLRRFFHQYLAKVEKSIFDHYKYGPGPVPDNNIMNLNTIGGQKLNTILRPEYNSNWDTAAAIHIASYKNVSLWNVTSTDAIPLLLEGARNGMTYFPSMIGQVHFVNCNKFATLLFKVLKPIISSDTMYAEAYHTDMSHWSQVLLKEISNDQLSSEFGGTKNPKSVNRL